ncbi:phosphopantetheine-binding protein [Streptomyces sp. NPDC053048]|uniref:phosphopantetheine-binding protein n=1 Tax=Streptomyces sp. NPDC053048 TaxID=3365694 RepID=UPI0037D6904C
METGELREIGKRAAEIWAEVLGMGPGQEKATFFELSGQSIAAVRIAGRVQEELGVWIDVGAFFDDPDMETFADGVVAAARAEAEA